MKKGQVSLEYFIIFTIIALLTILAFSSSFVSGVQDAVQGNNGVFQKAFNAITGD